ncbi:methylated-DNA--[bacterium]|nr:methylated-DNA--[protein]-cysteine S-methyltransferase [bacterium]
MTENFYYKSPIGILEINLENDFIKKLKVIENNVETSRLVGYFIEIAKQLDEFFADKRTDFDLRICPEGTDFQKEVWKELRKIPYGKTKSYQEIATAIGKPNAQRAVGLACNKNPILLIIPCHRVISKSGKLTGFACGLEIKETLLKLEKAI